MIFIKEEKQKLFTKIKEILTGILFRVDSSFFLFTYMSDNFVLLIIILLFASYQHILLGK